MIPTPRTDRHTLNADHPPQLLVLSDIAALLHAKLHHDHPHTQDWHVTTQDLATFTPSDHDDSPPDLIVLEHTTGAPHARTLLQHAKLHWPRTTFLLFTTRPDLDVHDLTDAYGDFPALAAATPRVLCAAIEREMTSITRGVLLGTSLPSLLQMLALDRKSVAVLVQTHHTFGRLHLRQGVLVDAYEHAGHTTGETAARRILAWPHVTLFLERSYHNQRHVITTPLENLLMDTMRERDEHVRDQDAVDLTDDLLEEDHDDPALHDRPHPASTPPHVPTPRAESEIHMSNLNATLESAISSIDGATAAALVDYGSGMALGMVGSGVNLEVAAAGNTDVVRAKMRTMQSLGIDGNIEDILITLDTQYHIIYILENQLFLYLVLQKDRANLALARYKLKALGTALKV